MTEVLPRVTIVTVNYNMRDGLERTISSVVAQTYPNLEYIVVDGASSDGSVEIIRRYEDRIARWTSEPDRNLYDGMNKGVAAASGEWLLFMNSGDCFADDNVISDIFSTCHQADLLYGHVIWRYEVLEIDRLVTAAAPEHLLQAMHCSHQSIFAKISVLRQFPFRLDLLIADYEFLVRCLSADKKFKMIDRVIARTTKDGLSDRFRLKALSQQQQILALYHYRTFGTRIRYPFAIVRAQLGYHFRKKLSGRFSRWFFSCVRGV